MGKSRTEIEGSRASHKKERAHIIWERLWEDASGERDDFPEARGGFHARTAAATMKIVQGAVALRAEGRLTRPSAFIVANRCKKIRTKM